MLRYIEHPEDLQHLPTDDVVDLVKQYERRERTALRDAVFLDLLRQELVRREEAYQDDPENVGVVQLGPTLYSYLDAAGHLRCDNTPLVHYHRWAAAPDDYTSAPEHLDGAFLYGSYQSAYDAMVSFDPDLRSAHVFFGPTQAGYLRRSETAEFVAQDIRTGRWMVEQQTLDREVRVFEPRTYATEAEAAIAARAPAAV